MKRNGTPLTRLPAAPLSLNGRSRYLAGMEPLTPDQARVLRDAIRSRTNYLHAVKNRMGQLGAGPGHPLYDLFAEAEAVMTRLAAELHDLTITRARRPWEPADG